MFGITEIKSNYKHRLPGYIVRLKYIDGIPSIYKKFLLKDYGGFRLLALTAALNFRKKEIKKLKQKQWYYGRRNSRKPTKRNKLNVLGVQRSKQIGGNRKWTGIYCYRTWWVDPSTRKIKTASFSERKYGAEQALWMATMCHIHKKHLFKNV
jgi:hypothetical protein